MTLHALGKNILCINFLIPSYQSEKEHPEGTFLNTLNNPGFMHILNKRNTWWVKELQKHKYYSFWHKYNPHLSSFPSERNVLLSQSSWSGANTSPSTVVDHFPVEINYNKSAFNFCFSVHFIFCHIHYCIYYFQIPAQFGCGYDPRFLK